MFETIKATVTKPEVIISCGVGILLGGGISFTASKLRRMRAEKRLKNAMKECANSFEEMFTDNPKGSNA